MVMAMKMSRPYTAMDLKKSAYRQMYLVRQLGPMASRLYEGE